MSEVTIFEFNGTQIRNIQQGDEVWFCAKDVCECLGIEWQGNKSISRIPSKWRGVGSFPTPGGPQEMARITEQGITILAFRSHKPEAMEFTARVADIVAQIRKHGAYLTPAAIERTLTDPDYLIQLAQRLKSEQLARLEAETARVTAEMARIAAETTSLQLAQECANLRPHAELGKQFVAVKNGATSSQVAANFCKSARWLNDFLHRRQRLKKVNGQWLLSGRWHDKPYLVTRHNFCKNSEGQLVDHPDSLWTPEGQIAVVQLLEHEGFMRVLSTQKLRTFPQKEQE